MTTAILLSGGVDSIALAAWKTPSHAITIDYGQRAAQAEIAAAAQVSEDLGMVHHVVRVDCTPIGSGDMAGTTPDRIAPVSEWWPYRNQLLITFAAAFGISHKIDHLILGSVSTDGSHADGTPEFYKLMNALLAAQEGNVNVDAPAISMTSVELVRVSEVTRDVLAWAHSCHVGPVACGGCRGCIKHYHVMDELFGEAY